MSNLQQTDQNKKKFIPAQVAIHNKAIDYLGLMQMCMNKINTLRKVIDDIESDRKLLPAFASETHSEILKEAIIRHDNQVKVYQWLHARYLTVLTDLFNFSVYHKCDPYPQTDAIKNATAA